MWDDNTDMFGSEEDLTSKIVVPFLASIGFDSQDLSFQRSFTIPGGRGFYRVDNVRPLSAAHPRCDILVKRGDQHLFVLELKRPDIDLAEDDIVQASTYARLLHPVAPFCIITNGRETKIIDSITRLPVRPDALKNQKNYQVSIEDDLYYETLKCFLGYSLENLLAFCHWQVDEYTKQLRGDVDDRTKNFIDIIYAPPEELTDAFREFLLSDRNCFLILGDSGTGKTCWMCYAAQEHVKQSRPTLFYRAVDVEQGLVAAIGEDLNWALSPDRSVSKAAKLFFELFEKDGVLVFVDGLDEIDPKVAHRLTNDFLKRIVGTSVKLVVTCKNTSWGLVRQKDGIPSRLSEAAFEVNGGCGYPLREPTDEHFSRILLKYRKFYGFSGSIEREALHDCQRNLFLLRIMFEVAHHHGLADITYASKAILSEYFDRIIERFDAEKDAAEGILIHLAGILYRRNQALIALDELLIELGLSPAAQLPGRLFELNILSRTRSQGVTRVSFYFSKLRDYLAAARYLKWSDLSEQEFEGAIQMQDSTGIRQDVLNLYYTLLAHESHKRILDGPIFEAAIGYTAFYESALNDHFATFNGAFAPFDGLPVHRPEPIGFVGFVDLQRKVLQHYGLRALKPGAEKVSLFPVSDSDNRRTAEDKRVSMAIATQVSSLTYRHSRENSKGSKIKKEVFDDLRRGLDTITKRGLLNESQNTELLLERVLGIAVRHYRDYLGIREPFLTETHLPLELDKIWKAALYKRALWVYEDEWREERIADGRIKEVRNGGVYSYSYSVDRDAREKMQMAAREAATRGEFVPSRYVDDPRQDSIESILKNDISCLNASGVQQISRLLLSPWDDLKNPSSYLGLRWKPETMKSLVEIIYTTFLNEYQTLVRHNFPTLCKEFSLYRRMPVAYFMTLNHDRLMPTGNLYICRNCEEANVTYVCKQGEIRISPSLRKLSHAGKEYELINESWLQPSSILSPNAIGGGNDSPIQIDWHKSVLWNQVYHQVRHDLEEVALELSLDRDGNQPPGTPQPLLGY